MNASNSAMTMYQAQLRASRALTDAVLNGARKLDELTLGVFKESVAGQMKVANAVFSGDASKGMASLRATWREGDLHKLMENVQRACDIVAETNGRLVHTLETYVDECGARNELSTWQSAIPQMPSLSNLFDMWSLTSRVEPTAHQPPSAAPVRARPARVAKVARTTRGKKRRPAPRVKR